jgi:hypothetical protein
VDRDCAFQVSAPRSQGGDDRVPPEVIAEHFEHVHGVSSPTHGPFGFAVEFSATCGPLSSGWLVTLELDQPQTDLTHYRIAGSFREPLSTNAAVVALDAFIREAQLALMSLREGLEFRAVADP